MANAGPVADPEQPEFIVTSRTPIEAKPDDADASEQQPTS